jgi:hypothetical protein
VFLGEITLAATFKSAFFAFPSEPAELRQPILSAAALLTPADNLVLKTWPQMSVFGAAIPDEVRGEIERSNVLVCDLTVPNLNVYYEIGFAIGLGKVVAPVVNASFASAIANIQRDGFFDIIGFQTYENSADLAHVLRQLPSAALIELYGKPLNTQQPLYFLNSYRKTNFVTEVAAAIKDSKVFYRSFDPAESARFSIIQALIEMSSSAGLIVPLLENYVDDAERHNLRGAFLAGLGHGLGRDVLLIRHQTADPLPPAMDFRDEIKYIRNEQDVKTTV